MNSNACFTDGYRGTESGGQILRILRLQNLISVTAEPGLVHTSSHYLL